MTHYIAEATQRITRQMKTPSLKFAKFFALGCFLSFAATSGNAFAADKAIMGWLEPVVIDPLNFRVKAKLDTGAKTSSIHALDIENFKRNGKPWVRFTFEAKDRKHESSKDDVIRRITLERRRVRNVIIKRHNSNYQERPVVEMTLCLDGRLRTMEFSLIDRTKFLYPVLLGRRALQKIALVDPSQTFITNSECQSALGKKETDKLETDKIDIEKDRD